MKKLSTLVISALLASSVYGHSLWIKGENGSKFNADMVYGHNFPTPEKIKPERVKLFEPVKVISDKGVSQLKQVGKFKYHFEGKKLQKGTYILNAFYKPTAWSKTVDGEWLMEKTRKDIKKEVSYCGISTMHAKALISIDGGDSNIISKTLNRKLEITPVFDSVKELKVGNLLTFKLTFNGKPVKFAEVYGSYGDYMKLGENYDHSKVDMAFAAFAKTDLEGKFYVRPLKKGLWFLKSTLNTQTGDKDCEIFNDHATLVFEVK